MNINALSEKIQHDVRRLASYKTVEEMEVNPDSIDMIEIKMRSKSGEITRRRHIKNATGWWLVSNSSRSFKGLLQYYVDHEYEFISIRTATLGEPQSLGGEL